MVNSLHTQVNREKIINSEQTSAPLTNRSMRDILNSAHMVAKSKLLAAKFHNDKKAIKELKATIAEAEEGLRILKAFDLAIVRLMERVAIRNFREETRRMKTEA